MKVLSLTEPYATLIFNGIKSIETRSWKTNYRGPIYIHASQTKIPKKYKDNRELMSLVDEKKLHFGEIICVCELVDCIKMTEEFIQDIKTHHQKEYMTGIYEIGRYAWILKNVEKIKNPSKVKGHLGLWNYES